MTCVCNARRYWLIGVIFCYGCKPVGMFVWDYLFPNPVWPRLEDRHWWVVSIALPGAQVRIDKARPLSFQLPKQLPQGPGGWLDGRDRLDRTWECLCLSSTMLFDAVPLLLEPQTLLLASTNHQARIVIITTKWTLTGFCVFFLFLEQLNPHRVQTAEGVNLVF